MKRQTHPSLADRIAHPRKVHRTMAIAAWVLIAALALVAGIATLRARRVEAETRRLIATTPAQGIGEEAAQATADAFARPRLAATIADLATHLPSGAPLAEAARGRDGTLRIAIDSADPDELRALLGGDSWFERFHEKAQERRSEGRIRVTLVEDDQ